MKIKIEDLYLVTAYPDGRVVFRLRTGEEFTSPNRKGRHNIEVIK